MFASALRFRAACVMIVCLFGTAVMAWAESPFTGDTGLRTLSFEMSPANSAPFLELPNEISEPDEPLLLPVSHARPLTVASSETHEDASASEGIQTASATTVKSEPPSTRARMRESLEQEGLEAAAARDSLTAEAMNVARWTFVTLLIGVGAVFAIKHLGVKNLPLQKRDGMKVVESLPLGRHQQLHLVDVSGERFVVACDGQGIKAMTLLPNWPGTEGETAATLPFNETLEAAKAA